MASGYTDPWEAPWCGEVTMRPISWIWDRYEDKAKDIKAEISVKNSEEPAFVTVWGKGYEENQDKWAKVYTIWMKDDSVEDYIDADEKEPDKQKKKKKKYPNGRILVICQDTILEDKPSMWEHGKSPYILFYDYKVPFQLAGMGEPDQMESLHLEFNLALKKVANYIRRYTSGVLIQDENDDIPEDELRKAIQTGQDRTFRKAQGSEVPQPIEWPQINPALLDFINAIPKLIEEVTGVTDVSKGQVTKKQRQSASEIATLAESSYTRTRQRVRNSEFAIKRALYLFVCLMQQYYKGSRGYVVERDGQYGFDRVGNSAEFMKQTLKPTAQMEPGMNPQEQQEIQQEQQDYEKFIAEFGAVDKVYIDFDLQIQTNSTLPMDRQSMANLMIKLLEMGAVDAKAVLEALRIPKADEIVERLQQIQYAGAAPQQPQPGPTPPGGASPEQLMAQGGM
jgi:hypothetical protein